MLKSSFEKWLVTVTLLIVIFGAVWHFEKSKWTAAHRQRQHAADAVSSSTADFHPYYVPQVPRPSNARPESTPDIEKLPRQKVEAWLAERNRDAVGLLAAFRALDDTNYLNEVATNFPNNPRVELAVLAHDEFPDDRRKWLDLFKASSPSNSLANYLSAQDDFENGNSGAAIQELQAASGKSQFQTYAIESQLQEEDLAQSCGNSPFEADNLAMTGFSKENLPELATYKRLAQGIAALEQQYINSSDVGSAANSAEMGMTLGARLESGDSGKYIINQLVAEAIESIALQNLSPDTPFGFLDGKTPREVMQENKQQRQTFIPTVMAFGEAYPSLTDDEKADYFNRSQIYGEVAAEKWAIQRHPSGNR